MKVFQKWEVWKDENEKKKITKLMIDIKKRDEEMKKENELLLRNKIQEE